MERLRGYPLHFSIQSRMQSSQTTILLAEDEATDVFLMRRALKKNSVMNPLQVVNNGEQAVAYLAGMGPYANRDMHPFPFLMLLDLKLPRLSGLEVLEWIRRQPAPVNRLPVVVLTSSKVSADINRAYELGANSYLVKPVTFEGLADMVKALELYWMVFNQTPEIRSEHGRPVL